MGGSLGGLTAALFLRDAGCDVHVYERSEAPLRDRGAGIVLHPATIRYLTENGIRTVAEIGVPAGRLRYLARDGGIASEAPCEFRFTSYYALYRDLLGCFDGERYHLGCEVIGFEADRRGVEVQLVGGQATRCDLLVCADGVRSSARARLMPHVSQRYAGYVGWRGAVAASELGPDTSAALEGAITYFVMPHSHLLAYPIPGAEGRPGVTAAAINWVWYRNVTAGEELSELLADRNGVRRLVSVPPGYVQPRHLAELESTAREALPAPLADLIARTAEPFVQAVFDIDVPRMAFGRICLIGDAAFALRPTSLLERQRRPRTRGGWGRRWQARTRTWRPRCAHGSRTSSRWERAPSNGPVRPAGARSSRMRGGWATRCHSVSTSRATARCRNEDFDRREVPMPAIGVNHVSVVARELEESLKFYEEVFAVERIATPNFGFPVQWLGVGAMQLHLFERPDPAPTHHHFAVTVDDFEATYVRAEERDAFDTAAFGHHLYELPGDCVQLYLRDPAGNLVEVDASGASALPPALSSQVRRLADVRPQTADNLAARLYLEI